MDTSLLATPSLESAAIISPDVPIISADPLRLGVLASGNGSNLEAIAQSIAHQKIPAQIQVLIYNNPSALAAERAARLAIPKVLLNHRDFATREALDAAIVASLHQHQVEWVIMAGWMRIVTPVLINAFPNQILNIHPSLLPSFPGIRAVEQALAAGVKIAGCTVHRVITAVDSGSIIIQAAVPVLPYDTPETLSQRIQVQEHVIFPRAIALVAAEATKHSPSSQAHC
jgi:phosphoribosylglycinamide formyltransferase-1